MRSTPHTTATPKTASLRTKLSDPTFDGRRAMPAVHPSACLFWPVFARSGRGTAFAEPEARERLTMTSRAVLRVCVAVLWTLIFSASAQAATITLTWDRNSEPDVQGYWVSYGTA